MKKYGDCKKRRLTDVYLFYDTKADTLAILDYFELLSEEEKEYLSFAIHKVWQENDIVSCTVDIIVNQIRSKGFKCVSWQPILIRL